MNLIYRNCLQSTLYASVLTPILVKSTIINMDESCTYIEFSDNFSGEVFIANYTGLGYWIVGNRGDNKFIPSE